MPRNPLSRLRPWRQLVTIAVILPLAVIAAVLAFAWPAGHIAPRDVPVGVVGASSGAQQVVDELDRDYAGAFDLRLYPSEDAARTAIEDRDVYGAFVVAGDGLTVMEASAASPSV